MLTAALQEAAGTLWMDIDFAWGTRAIGSGRDDVLFASASVSSCSAGIHEHTRAGRVWRVGAVCDGFHGGSAWSRVFF